jgi:membrane-bound metal-dependent hydrolase YbcI (DUF457 family)
MLTKNHVILSSTLLLSYSFYTKNPINFFLFPIVIFSSLLPDIDCESSRLGRLIPVGKFIGHRTITHSFLGCGLFTFGLYIAQFQSWYTYLILLVFGLTTLMIPALLELPKKLELLLSLLVLYGTFEITKLDIRSLNYDILFYFVFGYLGHLVGDLITVAGIPLLYPAKIKFKTPIGFRAGSSIETFLTFCLSCFSVYLILKIFNLF